MSNKLLVLEFGKIYEWSVHCLLLDQNKTIEMLPLIKINNWHISSHSSEKMFV